MAQTDTGSTLPGEAGATAPGVLPRAIAASSIGNATEWFDYGIYAYGVAYISRALFPGSAQEATLFALATFAISFLVRPFGGIRSEEHTSELQSLMRTSYAVFCLKKKTRP